MNQCPKCKNVILEPVNSNPPGAMVCPNCNKAFLENPPGYDWWCDICEKKIEGDLYQHMEDVHVGSDLFGGKEAYEKFENEHFYEKQKQNPSGDGFDYYWSDTIDRALEDDIITDEEAQKFASLPNKIQKWADVEFTKSYYEDGGREGFELTFKDLLIEHYGEDLVGKLHAKPESEPEQEKPLTAEEKSKKVITLDIAEVLKTMGFAEDSEGNWDRLNGLEGYRVMTWNNNYHVSEFFLGRTSPTKKLYRTYLHSWDFKTKKELFDFIMKELGTSSNPSKDITGANFKFITNIFSAIGARAHNYILAKLYRDRALELVKELSEDFKKSHKNAIELLDKSPSTWTKEAMQKALKELID